MVAYFPSHKKGRFTGRNHVFFSARTSEKKRENGKKNLHGARERLRLDDAKAAGGMVAAYPGEGKE